MVANREELIQYACIARATTILAHHRASSADPNIDDLASQCVAQAPPNHSLFSHTVNRRTYTFLVDPPFIFFSIFDHHLIKPLQLRFLHRLRDASATFLHSQSAEDNFTHLCFQSQFDSIFRDAIDFDDAVSRNPSVDSSDSSSSCAGAKVKRSLSATVPLLGKPAEGGLLKKKKRVLEANGEGKDGGGGAVDNKLEVCADDTNGGGCGGRDLSLAVAKGGAVNDHHHHHHHRQKAKHIWKKHVWVVLLLDLFVCAVLFVIWLWVCSGFKCMAY